MLYDCAQSAVVAARLQAGQVVADAEPADRHHRAHDGRARQPLHRARHHHLHLRRHGHAGVRLQLRQARRAVQVRVAVVFSRALSAM